ncbi:DUF1284 domain-containing protein [Agrobacterium vitis]|uniref:DUF1284 domain-containing protein n=1 Tax=Agrobacterium vitis TaxID=373 RepID=A0A6L6V5Y3_AGRVI|nr:DUF1284 domain-containing protein [Agrobacterium vitis]MUZ71124.1 DUF1284 domain-containing protein [Agrobacterium vitis]
MTVRLRGHHLLCMLTFVGEGYTADFVANYRRVAARLTEGETIEIVDGPDDLCQPLTHSQTAHCFRDSVLERDRKAKDAVAELLSRPVATGTIITPDAPLLARLRAAFAKGSVRSACHDCEWSSLCDGIAAEGYSGALVNPPAA